MREPSDLERSLSLAKALQVFEKVLADHDFETAAELSTQAIEAGTPDTELYADMCCSELYPSHGAVEADNKRGIKPDKAYLQKGLAGIKLKEGQVAVDTGSLYASGDSRFTHLMNECDDRIAEEATEVPLKSPAAVPVAPAALSGATNVAPAPENKEDGASMETENGSLEAPVRYKYRHDYYNSTSEVVLTIFAEGIPSDRVVVDFGEQMLSVSIELPGEEPYHFEHPLHSKIIPEHCKYDVLSTMIEIRLAKAEQVTWTSLDEPNFPKKMGISDCELQLQEDVIITSQQQAVSSKRSWSVKQILQYLSAIGARRLGARTSVLDLPVAVIPQILRSVMSEFRLRRLVSSSYIFSRSAFRPCLSCDQEPSKFIGILCESACRRELLVARPYLLDQRIYVSAGVFLEDFIYQCSAGRPWFRILACNHGHIAVLTDVQSNRIDMWSPFFGLRVVTLPPAPWYNNFNGLLTAAILPLPRGSFRLILVFRNDNQIVLKDFSGHTGTWTVAHILIAAPMSTSRRLKARPVVISSVLHLLDDQNGRIFTIDVDQNTMGFMPLPEVDIDLRIQDQILGKNLNGDLCWIMLNKRNVSVFTLGGDDWVQRHVFQIPEYFWACKLTGHSDGTGQLILGCYELTCSMSIEDGRCNDLSDVPPLKDGCFCFDLPHSFVDHSLP